MKTHWKELHRPGVSRVVSPKREGRTAATRSAPSADAGATVGSIADDVRQLRFAEFREGLADDSLEAAEALEREQQALLEAAPIEQAYEEGLELHIRAKHDQVQRIEDRLETLIDQQQARMQQLQAKAPGLIALPATKRAWTSSKASQEARLMTLHNRLETVREIKEGMGIHAPRIEELATRKMRAENPELASDWDAMREAARMHQIERHKQEQEQEKRQKAARSQVNSLGLQKP